jgi:hypothetical protein
MMKKLLLLNIFSILFALFLPFCAQAQVQLDPNLRPGYAANIEAPGGNRAAVTNAILQLIAGGLIYAAGPMAVLIIAWGGLQYVTSHGDQTKMENAKKTIMWAIIGLLVIIISWAVVSNIITIIAETGTGTVPRSQ